MKDFFELRESVKTEDKGQFIYAAKQAKKKGDSTFVFAGKTYNCEEVLENEDLKESVLNENYRTLARAGMGTESKGEARVGLELDYYDGSGTKRMGKITKLTSKGYMVKDDKDGKVRQFAFHDRAKAKEILARIGKGKYNESVELDEASAKIKTTTPDKVVSSAKRFSLKAKAQGGVVSISGPKGKLDDYVRAIIGRDSYGNASDVTESVELEESKTVKVSRADFDKLKKGSIIDVDWDGAMSAGAAALKVVSKSRSAKHDVDKIKLMPSNGGRSAPFFLYSRKGGDATLAIGDMGASMTKYKIVKEDVELVEAVDFEKMSKELLKHKSKGIEFEKAAAFARVMFMNSSLHVQDKAMKGMLALLKDIDDLTVKTTLTKILKDNGFKVKGGRVMR